MTVKKGLIVSSVALVVFLLLIFLAANYVDWRKNYADRVYPGLRVGDLALGGQTATAAKDLIATQAQKIENDGLTFRYNGQTALLSAAIFSFDSDLSYPALSYDAAATVEKAWGEKNERTFWYFLRLRLHLKKAPSVNAVYSLNTDKIKSFLADNFKDLNISALNAYFSFAPSVAGEEELKINPEKIGKQIDYDAVFKELAHNLAALKNEALSLKTRSQYPTVIANDLKGREAEARKLMDGGALTLSFTETGGAGSKITSKLWEIGPEQLVTWLNLDKSGNQASLSLDQKKIKNYLLENVATLIDQEPVQARFEIKDGKVSSWQTGKNGRRLNLEGTSQIIAQAFLNGQNEIALTAEEVPSENLAADNTFNIKEIIGTGASNFAGSPSNRRYNIKVGANTLNGLLIKPDEEFSLVKALGDVSKESGYLPELVIKGDKTVPEYGGGLCQIGTTIFRAALASGLPITARQNHSYRVSYYEPAGMDAAVYIPWPDVRFINDTGNYILIQARIEGDNLYFDFWGVKDGRIATMTTPVIYNIVKPEPTKIVPSADLAPGEKKCTESSHNGADTYFDYTVIYPVGATTTPVQTRRFSSHYVPWQGVCLVGATSTPLTASSTDLNAPLSTKATTTAGNNQKAAETPAATSSQP